MRSELQWGAARLCAERHVRPSSRLWKRLSKGSANVTLQRTCRRARRQPGGEDRRREDRLQAMASPVTKRDEAFRILARTVHPSGCILALFACAVTPSKSGAQINTYSDWLGKSLRHGANPSHGPSFLLTMKDPPSQSPGSFNLRKIEAALRPGGCRLSSRRRDRFSGLPIGCSGRRKTSQGGRDPGRRDSRRASYGGRHTARACRDRAPPRDPAPSAP